MTESVKATIHMYAHYLWAVAGFLFGVATQVLTANDLNTLMTWTWKRWLLAFLAVLIPTLFGLYKGQKNLQGEALLQSIEAAKVERAASLAKELAK